VYVQQIGFSFMATRNAPPSAGRTRRSNEDAHSYRADWVRREADRRRLGHRDHSRLSVSRRLLGVRAQGDAAETVTGNRLGIVDCLGHPLGNAAR
jgi:hypothetical protein